MNNINKSSVAEFFSDWACSIQVKDIPQSVKKKLNIEGEITKSFEKYPYTQTYDCSSNFAPITLFNYEEMINFKWKRELNERVR